jgi:hypothetical protein
MSEEVREGWQRVVVHPWDGLTDILEKIANIFRATLLDVQPTRVSQNYPHLQLAKAERRMQLG